MPQWQTIKTCMTKWHVCHNGMYDKMACMTKWHVCRNGMYDKMANNQNMYDKMAYNFGPFLAMWPHLYLYGGK